MRQPVGPLLGESEVSLRAFECVVPLH
jgi:hypothetical protein